MTTPLALLLNKFHYDMFFENMTIVFFMYWKNCVLKIELQISLYYFSCVYFT